MMRNGPIPLFLHGVLEYVVGVAFVLAPFLLDFDSGAATALSVVVGVGLLAIAAATDGPTSLIDEIPRSAHVALDYMLAILLIALPFLAGFSDETPAAALFIGVGILHLLVTIGTRFQTRGERTADAEARPQTATEATVPPLGAGEPASAPEIPADAPAPEAPDEPRPRPVDPPAREP